jgi:hypothetical protein
LNAIVFDRKPSSPACCCSSSTMGRPIAIMSATAAVSEPEAVASCFEDVAVMSEAVEERGRHLCVTEAPWFHGSGGDRKQFPLMPKLTE